MKKTKRSLSLPRKIIRGTRYAGRDSRWSRGKNQIHILVDILKEQGYDTDNCVID